MRLNRNYCATRHLRLVFALLGFSLFCLIIFFSRKFSHVINHRSDNVTVLNSEMIQLDQNNPQVKNELAAFAGYWYGPYMKQNLDCGYWQGEWQGHYDFHFFGFNAGQLGPLLGALILDPTSAPKKLDWIESQSTRRGVYKLEGDALRIAFAVGNSPRPNAIDSKVKDIQVLTFKRATFKSPEYYEKKLLDKNYSWRGPRSMGEYPPTMLSAAIALAYLGDSAVPALFRAVKNESIDIYSLNYALDDIGLPVHKYKEYLYRRDPTPLEKWWVENRERTAISRSEYRVTSGLPPVEGVEIETMFRRPWPIVEISVICGILLLVAVVIIALRFRGKKRKLSQEPSA